MNVEITKFKALGLKNPIMVEGFPGIGMIGTIATSYMVEALSMEWVGVVSSSHFPPVIAVHDFKPMSPVRIYASKKHDLVVFVAEFVIPSDIVDELAKKLVGFAKEEKVKAIYSLAGIATPEEEGSDIYAIPSTTEMMESLKKHNIKMIKEGAAQGLSGVLISKCALQNLPAANLMIQTQHYLDPIASSKILNKLSTIIGVPVDTHKLLEQAELINTKLKETLGRIKGMNKDYKNLEENPLMYS